MSVLVTGGAGYIGSHTVAELNASGAEVVIVDDLSQGHRAAVDTVGCPMYRLDIHDASAMREVMLQHRIDTVIHFAASSLVGESMSAPLKYYQNNVSGSERLLSAMVEAGVKRIVFSSSAAVYGEPECTPIPETAPLAPTNPYGESKVAIERMLRWCYEAYGISSVSLRYFNAAGSHPELPLLEAHHPETHLIPIVLQAAAGRLETVHLYGTDYPTPDGTCVRDYIHVVDLARAHRLAVDRLRTGGISCVSLNLGIGKGFSVREVIDACQRVTGRTIPVQTAARRAGDPAVLVAAPASAKELLGWTPEITTLEPMVASVWRWMTDISQ